MPAPRREHSQQWPFPCAQCLQGSTWSGARPPNTKIPIARSESGRRLQRWSGIRARGMRWGGELGFFTLKKGRLCEDLAAVHSYLTRGCREDVGRLFSELHSNRQQAQVRTQKILVINKALFCCCCCCFNQGDSQITGCLKRLWNLCLC